jgi:hypothetical protein
MVVVVAPCCDQVAGMVRAVEEMLVQKFAAQAAVE